MESNLPTHVAIIPDGTRRWARKRGLPDIEGSRAGAETVHQTVAYLLDAGLRYLTIWGFSSDNWKRSEEQVKFLFEQAQAWIERDAPWLHSRGGRLCHIGRIDRLPQGLQQAIAHWGEVTGENTGMTVIAAFDYSGRAEILDTVRRLVMLTLDNAISFQLRSLKDMKPSELVPEELFRCCLNTNSMPDVDLVIRTGGELRLSNFMLWQTAYSELYFTDTLWPDFNSQELDKALQAYATRQRRFGGD